MLTFSWARLKKHFIAMVNPTFLTTIRTHNAHHDFQQFHSRALWRNIKITKKPIWTLATTWQARKLYKKRRGIVLAHSEFSGLQGRFKLKCQSCITKKDILIWLKRRVYRFGLTPMTIGFLQIGHEQAIIKSLPTKKQQTQRRTSFQTYILYFSTG